MAIRLEIVYRMIPVSNFKQRHEAAGPNGLGSLIRILEDNRHVRSIVELDEISELFLHL